LKGKKYLADHLLSSGCTSKSVLLLDLTKLLAKGAAHAAQMQNAVVAWFLRKSVLHANGLAGSASHKEGQVDVGHAAEKNENAARTTVTTRTSGVSSVQDAHDLAISAGCAKSNAAAAAHVAEAVKQTRGPLVGGHFVFWLVGETRNPWKLRELKFSLRGCGNSIHLADDDDVGSEKNFPNFDQTGLEKFFCNKATTALAGKLIWLKNGRKKI
jgi:hypothetical protein